MARENVQHLAFNRGIMSPLAAARIDLQRQGLSAETQTNWMPRALGSMMLRPGWGYLGSTASDAVARLIPFVYAADDTALIEVSGSSIRFWIDDAVITRPAVATSITNGAFDTDLTGWTDGDEAGATSAWATGGYMALAGTGTAAAIRTQAVTVNGADINDEHALRIVVLRGPVTLRVGSTDGGDEYISETNLGAGTHSLAFTPTGTFYVRFQTRTKYSVVVESCEIESSGAVALPSPWVEADLDMLRWDASADVTYVACYGYQPRKIERRAARSWSIVKYEPEDGPFRILNTSPTTITASVLSGDGTLTASAPYFRSTHVGALFRHESSGQTVTATITAQNSFTNEIRVSGVGGQRSFTVQISGTFTATVVLQYSLGSPGTWVDDATSWTAAATVVHTDTFDNQVVYYRLGVKTGGFTSGTITATLTYALGSITGIAKTTGYTSSTVMSAVILQDFGATTASADWSEGAWSDLRGYPSAVALFDGRLWWAGKARMFGSVSDGYESFDDTLEGDSAPINRAFGSGPVDKINWIIATNEMFVGTASAEVHARSSSQAEILTPTNFNLRSVSTQGSGGVRGDRIDERGVFVQRGGTRLFDISFDTEMLKYTTSDLSMLTPDLNAAGIVQIAIQRKPDTRVHCVRADGTVAVLVYEKAENVTAWVELETDGDVEDVAVLPGTNEDDVYYIVNRDGGRFVEKWAQESECIGGTVNKLADSFVAYQGASISVMAGFDHLEGQSVTIWADGADRGTATVSGGTVTLGGSYGAVVCGLTYEARWQSMRKALAAAMGTPLNQPKRIPFIGLLLKDTHAQGLEYGPDFDTMDNLPLIEDDAAVADDTIHDTYEGEMIEFPGEWDTDSRVCLRATAPRPATVLSCVATVMMNETGT